MSEWWRPAYTRCEVCSQRDFGQPKPGFVGEFWTTLDVGGELKICCPDCQRTVMALRNLDKVVNG